MQAARWSRIADAGGYIYSFNGPHSLFVDTIRSLRSLAVGHQLGHALMGENGAGAWLRLTKPTAIVGHCLYIYDIK